MAQKQKINYVLEVDEKGAVTAIKKLGNEVDKTTREMKNKFSIAGDVIKANLVSKGIELAISKTKDLMLSTIAYGDRLDKLNKRLGISTEQLDKLKQIAELSGISFETLTMSLQRLQRRIAEAANGSGEAVGALKELGLSAAKLVNLPLDEQFRIVAERLDKIQNSGTKTRLTMKLMDSEGVQLIQMFHGLGTALKNVTSGFSDKAVKTMAKFNDNFTVLITNIQEHIVPVLTTLMGRVNELFATGKEKEKLEIERKLENATAGAEIFRREIKRLEEADSWWGKMKAKAELPALKDSLKTAEENAAKFRKELEKINQELNKTSTKPNLPTVGGGRNLNVPIVTTPNTDIRYAYNQNAYTKATKEQATHYLKILDIIDEVKAKEEALGEVKSRQLHEARSYYDEQSMAQANANVEIKKANDSLEQKNKIQKKNNQLLEQANQIVASDLTQGIFDLIEGAQSFGDVIKGIIKDLAKLYMQQAILTGLSKIKFAQGGVFENGNVTPFAAGGIVNSPTIFPMANGMGLMGEAGPEAVMPLTRTSSGDLGVKSEDGGTQTVNYYIQAVDSQSFDEAVRRNPGSINRVVNDAIERGDQKFLSNIKMAATR